MAQEIYVVIEFDRETHEFSEIEAIYQSKEEAENLVKEYNAKFFRYSYEWFEGTYHVEEVDSVLAEKDAEIRRLNRKYWNDKADEAAKMKRLIYDGRIIYLDDYCNEQDWRIMHKVWEDEETKCRAKAEEYK